MYRPPASNYLKFAFVMEDILNKLFNCKKYIMVRGDFNIDLLRESSLNTNISALFKSFGLNNLFMEPKRITATSSTCIDNIYCNCFDNIRNHYVFNCLPSDHSGLFSALNMVKEAKPEPFLSRSITANKIDCFVRDLEYSLSTCKLESEDPNTMFAEFFDIHSYMDLKVIFLLDTIKTRFHRNSASGQPLVFTNPARNYMIYTKKKRLTILTILKSMLKNTLKCLRLYAQRLNPCTIETELKNQVIESKQYGK